MRGIEQRIMTWIVSALVVAAPLVTLTACVGSVAPPSASSRRVSVSSPTPTERDGNTDDTNSKAFKGAERSPGGARSG
jgi:hypothetical protein